MKLTRESLLELLNRRRMAYVNVPAEQKQRQYDSLRKLVMLVAVVGSLLIYGRNLAKNVPAQGLKQVAASGITGGVRTETPALAGASAAGATVLVVDSPATDLEAAEIAMVSRSTRSLDVAFDDFSDVDLASTLVKLKAAGVWVRVLLARSDGVRADAGRASVVRELEAGSVDVRLAARPGHMGLSSFALDGALLRTGAVGWTPGSLKGVDATGEIVYVESRPAVSRFVGKFNDLWESGEPVGK